MQPETLALYEKLQDIAVVSRAEGPARRLADYPEVMTVAETAEYLNIGTSTCYAHTKRYLASGGTHGLPCVKIGGRTKVLRHRLQTWLDNTTA